MHPAFAASAAPGPEHPSPLIPQQGDPARELGTLSETIADARLSDQAFRTLADFIPHIIWTTHPNGVLDYCNRRFYEYTGIQPDGVTLHSDWNSAIHAEDFPAAHEHWKTCIRTGETYEVEIRVRKHLTKEYRRHLARAVPLHDTEGKNITKWFGICIDIEDLKRNEERLAFQSRINTALGSSLDVGETLCQIARLCVPDLADWCRIDVIDESGRQRTEVVAHRDPSKERLLQQVVGRRRIIASKKITLNPDPQDHAVYEDVGYGASISVPLVGHNGTLGAFMLVSSDPQRVFSDDERTIAEELGRRAGVAMENSQIFAREHRIATTLQRALLPNRLPKVDGIMIDWEYRPATQESQVGGDWYDVFTLPDGSVFLSIGDVCGHGLEAAIAMSTIRQSLRSLVFAYPDPRLALQGINRILQYEQGETIATAIFARFHPETLLLEYAGAGHPAPILMHEGKSPSLLPVGGVPLGVLPGDGEISWESVRLEPGSTILFYTDGLIEFSRDVIREEDRLLRVIANVSPLDTNPAGTVVDNILAGMPQRDDIAALVLRAEQHPLEKIEVTLPSIPASAATTRGFLRRFIRAHALTESESFRLLTACGEAVANAAEYAYNTSPEALRLTVTCNGQDIEVAVHDAGTQTEASERLSESREPRLNVPDASTRTLDEDPNDERGRGLVLMHALCDDVRIRRENSGLSVYLRICRTDASS